MTKYLSLIALVLTLAVWQNARANIQFITETGYSDKNTQGNINERNPFQKNSRMLCREAGYQRYGCPSGFKAIDPCPQNGRLYKECCSEEFAYTPEQCAAEGLSASAKSCGGLYACVKK